MAVADATTIVMIVIVLRMVGGAAVVGISQVASATTIVAVVVNIIDVAVATIPFVFVMVVA